MFSIKIRISLFYIFKITVVKSTKSVRLQAECEVL